MILDALKQAGYGLGRMYKYFITQRLSSKNKYFLELGHPFVVCVRTEDIKLENSLGEIVDSALKVEFDNKEFVKESV